jgi:hypothetical protein
MDKVKQILFKMIEDIPESQIPEVIDFIAFLRVKKSNQVFKDIEKASESSMAFWNNEKDDEVWNNV